jgi:hypothetical protein
MVSVEYMYSYTSHAHELRRVSAGVGEIRRQIDVVSNARTGSDEASCNVSVDRVC